MYTRKPNQFIPTEGREQFRKIPLYTRSFTRSDTIYDNKCSLNLQLANQKTNDVDLYFSMKNNIKLMNDIDLWRSIFEKEFGITRGNVTLDNFVLMNNNKTIFEYYMFKKYNNKIMYCDYNSDHYNSKCNYLDNFMKFTKQKIDLIDLLNVSVFKTKFGLKMHYKCNYDNIVKNVCNFLNYLRSHMSTNLLQFKENDNMLELSKKYIGHGDQTSMFMNEFYILLNETKDGIRINIVGLKDSMAFNNWGLFLNLLMKEFDQKVLSKTIPHGSSNYEGNHKYE